ncbi:MAG: glycosyltransferase [Balneolaceae bacterium]
MSAQPYLSVLITTHAPPERVETLLGDLLGFRLDGCEIVVINDAAGSACCRAIRLLLDMYPDVRTTCIEHTVFHGRAQSLNKGLYLSGGSLIWAPLEADRLNKHLLGESIRKLSDDPAAFSILDRSLPPDIHGWLEELEGGTLPPDNHFLFNRTAIPPGQLFFREKLGPYTAAELAWRIMQRKSHQTVDSFFVINKIPGPRPDSQVLQEFLFSMLREIPEAEERESVIEKLKAIDFTPEETGGERPLLDRARELIERDARLALDLVNSCLKEHPDHQEAMKLKINLLGKLRRHVEAAELKHHLQKKRVGSNQKNGKNNIQPTLFTSLSEENGVTKKDRELSDGKPEEPGKGDIKISIIIPTTGDGKPYLQECLVQLDKVCDASTVELIVVDNASIDDTFDYLNQLKEEDFLNIRVITNAQNAGFGKSVNQGIHAAAGKYALIMHNDLLLHEGAIEEMAAVLDNHQYIGATGPAVDKCDNKEQLSGQIEGRDEPFVKVDYLDSCCLLLRLSTGVTFSEAYGLAYCEDKDLCNCLSDHGYYAAVTTRARAVHHYRTTTRAMGLNLEPELWWINTDIYNARWNKSPELKIPEQGEIAAKLELIPLPVNPLNPSGHWIDQIDALFTDEVKTEIQKRNFKDKNLFNLIRILLAADKRDFLRQTESRISHADLPEDLLKDLIRYYYRRNIYSRCRLYLEKPGAIGPFFDLYRLRISVEEKEAHSSVGLLTDLMNKFPCHPGLYRIAGDIHRMEGNEGEAKSFYALANQLNPADDTGEEEVFEIKY